MKLTNMLRRAQILTRAAGSGADAPDVRLLIHTAQKPEAPGTAQKRSESAAPRVQAIRPRARTSFQDKLLRKSCIACAVLLGILALGNVQRPWAVKASQNIERALTMKIDLDESLGRLSFVKRIMPESARVFFNLSGDHELLTPVQGKCTHPYEASQPWLMFEAEGGATVCATAAGTVSAVSALSDGSYGVLIDHGNGSESVTACLATASVQNGDVLPRGAAIGSAAGPVYFELRLGGEACDPTAQMGL